MAGPLYEGNYRSGEPEEDEGRYENLAEESLRQAARESSSSGWPESPVVWKMSDCPHVMQTNRRASLPTAESTDIRYGLLLVS